MSAPGKCPDEVRRRAIRLALGASWPIRIGPGGVWGASAKGLGSTPGPCMVGSARPGLMPARGPAPPGVEAQRLRELEKEVRESGAGGAIRRGASAFLLWWSVSAHRADPRPGQGSSGPVPDLHCPDPVRLHDRPRPLDSRRPVPPALEEVGVRRRRGREDPRPEGGAASTRHSGRRRPGTSSTPRTGAPGSPALWVGRMRALGLSGPPPAESPAPPGRTAGG